MLRPSRPMIRPFMSSEGSCTTETVVSAAWLAARRCIATDRIERTRRSASRLVSSSIWRRMRAESWRAWSSTSLSSACLRLAGAEAGDALERRRVLGAARSCARLVLRQAQLARRSSSARAAVEVEHAPVERALERAAGARRAAPARLAAGQRAGRSRRDGRRRASPPRCGRAHVRTRARPRSGPLPERPPRSRIPLPCPLSPRCGASRRARLGAYVGREEPDRSGGRQRRDGRRRASRPDLTGAQRRSGGSGAGRSSPGGPFLELDESSVVTWMSELPDLLVFRALAGRFFATRHRSIRADAAQSGGAPSRSRRPSGALERAHGVVGELELVTRGAPAGPARGRARARRRRRGEAARAAARARVRARPARRRCAERRVDDLAPDAQLRAAGARCARAPAVEPPAILREAPREAASSRYALRPSSLERRVDDRLVDVLAARGAGAPRPPCGRGGRGSGSASSSACWRRASGSTDLRALRRPSRDRPLSPAP